MGAPRLLSDLDLEDINNEIAGQTFAMDSLRYDQTIRLIYEKMNIKFANNSISANVHKNQPYSNLTADSRHRTVLNYYKRCNLLKVKGDTKNKSRSNAFDNLRNGLSLCAVIESTLKNVDPELLCSSDDTSIIVNEWTKPDVISNKHAKDIMNAQHLGVSTTEDQQQRRIVVLNITLAAKGDLICCVAKVSDYNFTQYMQQPCIFDMGDNIFIMLYHPNLSDLIVNIFQYLCCIIPKVSKFRDNLINRDNRGLDDRRVFLPTPINFDDIDNNTNSNSNNINQFEDSEHNYVIEFIWFICTL